LYYFLLSHIIDPVECWNVFCGSYDNGSQSGESKVCRKTRDVCNATMFQMSKSPESEAMRKIVMRIADRRIREEIEKQSLKA